MNVTTTTLHPILPGRRFFAVLLLAVLAGGCLLTTASVLQARRWMHETLSRRAAGAAMALNPAVVQSLSDSAEDLGASAHERIRSSLAFVCRDIPDCRLIELLIRKPDSSVVVLLASTLKDPADPCLKKPAIREESREALAAFSPDAVAKVQNRIRCWRNGRISVYAPLKELQTGKVLAVLCMDVAATEPDRQMRRAAVPPVLLTAGLVLLTLLGSLPSGTGNRRRLGARGEWLQEHRGSILIAATGLLLTAYVARDAHRAEGRAIFRNFAHLADSEHGRILSDLRFLGDTSIQASARFMEVGGAVTAASFDHFVGAFGTRKVASAWGWAPRVAAADRETFEARIRAGEDASFRIWELGDSGKPVPAGERPVHYPIRFTGPSDVYGRGVGFDLASEPLRRAALEVSLDTRVPTSTPPVRSAFDPVRNNILVAFYPIHDPESLLPRGLVVATIHPKALIQPLHGGGPVHHQLELVGPDRVNTALATSCPTPGHVMHDMTSTSYLGVLEAVFKISSHPGPAFYEENPRWAAWTTVATGLLLTAAAAFLLTLPMRSHRRLERMVADRTSELQASEDRYRLLVEQSRSIVYRLSPDGILSYVSPAWKQLLGHAPETIVGRDCRSLLHPDDIAACAEFMRGILEGREAREAIEYRVRHRDGSWRWHLSVLALQSNEGNGPKALIGNASDITDFKKVQAERERLLAEAEESRRVLLNMLEDQAQVEKDLRRHEALLGAAAEASQLLLSARPLDEVARAALELIGRTVDQDRVYLFEYHVDPATGERLTSQRYEWAREGIEPQIDNPSLQNLSLDRHCPRWYRLLSSGHPVEGAVRDFPAQERADLEAQGIVSILAVPVQVNGVFWGFLGFDDCSAVHAWRTSERAILTALAASLGSAIAQHRIAQDLRQTLERHQAILEANPDIMFVFSAKGEIIDFHAADRSKLYRNPSEFMGRNVAEVLPLPTAGDTLRHIRSVLATGTIEEYGYSLEFKDEIRHFESRMVRCGEDRVLAVVHDITARRHAAEEQERLREQLAQAQKLDSVGRLAGGVAHDFNNMLQAILGHTELALDQLDPSMPVYADLQEIQKAATRSANLTQQLLAFARKQTVSPKVIDLNENVERMLKMLQRLIGENVALVWKPGGGVGPVKIDPSQLDQILANLCVNARDAIPNTGNVILETAPFTIEEDYLASHEGVIAGDYVMLAVSDNGCGMDPATVAKLFEPFFTTKRLGEGTGLGLSTIYGIVRQNGGFIQVYSEPGHGTTFKIFLPRARHAVEQERPPSAPAHALRGNETILLVEDEPVILDMAKKMLTRQGYKVLAASSPDFAVQMARSHGARIDLLLTDVIMPGMNGSELAETLRTLYPDLKVLFMSGYTANVIAHYRVLDDGMNFIQKPFTVQDLSASVRRTLAHCEQQSPAGASADQ